SMSASEVFSSKPFSPIIAPVIGVLQIKVEARNPNPAEITDPHPQRRPHRQPSESAARAALLPASYTTRRDTIPSWPAALEKSHTKSLTQARTRSHVQRFKMPLQTKRHPHKRNTTRIHVIVRNGTLRKP
ncbi:MAG: hypothetical protein WCS20_06775, partial [Alphaproteobacteria bacterium]